VLSDATDPALRELRVKGDRIDLPNGETLVDEEREVEQMLIERFGPELEPAARMWLPGASEDPTH
jgi:hypothetical protein